MKGLQGFIYQKNNLLLDAAIAATVAASGKLPLIYPLTKQGNGNIAVTGAYNGADDARYEVEIADTDLENPVVSVPTFKGAGSGKISDISVSGLAAQKITVRCIETGVNTTSAEIEIEGVRFGAKTPGAAGNNITIDVDDSSLVYTDSGFSTVKDIKAGDNAIEGQEFDWETVPLQAGLVPEDAKRVAFGQDKLHIYLQYKVYDSGEWKYNFIPEIKNDVPAGTKVYFVTEGRTVTLADGVYTEPYEGIISIADLWQQVKASSEILAPLDLAIDVSRAIDSFAVREFALKTRAYSLAPYAKSGSSEYAGGLDSIIVHDDKTKTELISLECYDNTFVGAELWKVTGSASGDLGTVKTGDFNDLGPAGFSIPQKLPKDYGNPQEDWSYKITYVSRGTGITPPPICLAFRLGINAAPQTLELEYKMKDPECPACPPVYFSDTYLGFKEKGGEIGMAYTVPDLNYWLDALKDRMMEAIGLDAAEVSTVSMSLTGYFAKFKTLAARIMALPENDTAALALMVTNLKALGNSITLFNRDADAWQSTHGYATGDYVKSSDGWLFSCNLAGTSGATEPVWVKKSGATTTDNTITWTCLGASEYSWDDAANHWSPEDAPYSTNIIYDVRWGLTAYAALVDAVLEYERTYGVKKNSIIDPDVPYIEPSGDYYWEVKGSKAYLPMDPNSIYYSVFKSGDKIINSQEFALKISTACGGSLIEGDRITITIGGIKFEPTYQVGDVTYLPTVAAQGLHLLGGVDGDDSYVWEIDGAIPFDDYVLDRNAPAAYTSPNLSFLLTDGIVRFQVGDSFEFSIESGHFKWRKDGGAWSALLPISQAAQDLDSGLDIGFSLGVNPSFMIGDSWEVLCSQENRASNMTDIGLEQHKGTGNKVFSFDAEVDIDTLIIDNYLITGDFRFQASNNEDFSGELIHDELIAAADRPPLIRKLYLDELITAKYFRLAITGESLIGFVFLGNTMQLSVDADEIKPVRQYMMDRKTGKLSFGLTNYVRVGYTLNYNTFLRSADFALLDALVEWSKGNNDEPFYFIPNVDYPDVACIKGTIDADNIEMNYVKDDNVPAADRLYTIVLPIVGTR
jgi:hypothetical protein